VGGPRDAHGVGWKRGGQLPFRTFHPPSAATRRYRVLLHSKYDRNALQSETFDFIVDNNPATFACCLSHFAAMLELYAAVLAEDGRAVTDIVGLG
jgi:hypothetical protein